MGFGGARGKAGGTAAGGSGPPPKSTFVSRIVERAPTTWTSLFLAAVAAASAVAYFNIERERRLEKSMGQIVSSELPQQAEGWTPMPGSLAKRKYFATKYGWFPEIDDVFGACTFSTRLIV